MRNYQKYIDHTNLKNSHSKEQMLKFFEEAKPYGFASVCILPIYVPLAVNFFQNSPTKVCAVVGFPLGANTISTKVSEAVELVKLGADEIDIVWNINKLKSGEIEYLVQEIQETNKAIKEINPDTVLKVIVETALLTECEKKIACQIMLKSQPDFIKTSTGFSAGGATVADIELFATELQGSGILIKASGGVKTVCDAEKMVKAGASRLGTSSGIQIVDSNTTSETIY